MAEAKPEVWLRGPLDGYDPHVMPVAHSLSQVREDVLRIAAGLDHERLWARPGGAASVGFHLLHLAGSVDRLFTYARGQTLNAQQTAALAAERTLEASRPPLHAVVAAVTAALDDALAELRAVTHGSLLDARAVGRAGLPSTVGGLLFHAAEHATRHAGQAITTARILAAGDGR